MKVNGANVKQIRRGVYYTLSSSTVNVGRYCYTIPVNSVVIPEENLIYLKTRKGCFEWKYIPSKELWIVREIGDEGAKINAIDPHNFPNDDDEKIIITEQEGNKAHIFKSSHNGTTTNEWRFFTSFFIDVLRKTDLAR